MGFTDVYFCPLLVNDIADIFTKMLGVGLAGVYHVLSSDSMSKYDFGVAIAKRFGFDHNLITPTSVWDSGLDAARSPNLTLKVDKLIHDLGETLPPHNIHRDREVFHALSTGLSTVSSTIGS